MLKGQDNMPVGGNMAAKSRRVKPLKGSQGKIAALFPLTLYVNFLNFQTWSQYCRYLYQLLQMGFSR